MADDVRGALVALRHVGDENGLRLRLASWIDSLENAGAVINPSMQSKARSVERCRYLIESLPIADCLSKDADLKNVLQRCDRLVLPRETAEEVIATMGANNQGEK